MFPPRQPGPPQAQPMPPQGGAPAPGGAPGGPPGPGGAPGAPQPGGGVDPNNPMQQMLLQRLQQLPEPALRALQNLPPPALEAIKMLVPEIGFVLDGLATGAGQQPAPQPGQSQIDQGDPEAGDASAEDEEDDETAPPFARPQTRLGKM